MDIDAYLQRINYHGGTAPTLETLVAVHQARLGDPLNLDILRYLALDQPAMPTRS